MFFFIFFLFYFIFIFLIIFDKSVKQAGAELGQAQLKLKLKLGFTLFKIFGIELINMKKYWIIKLPITTISHSASNANARNHLPPPSTLAIKMHP